ncbi:MAG TPA: PaaI family thioesterase [Methylomirabilota bacterium]|nr:PaaI family thioesterase [Methylomirabilota bacterium]
MQVALRRSEAEAILRRPFLRAYGFVVRALRPGECTLDVPFRPRFERPGGVVAGPVFMAAADVAMWLAILSRLGRHDTSVTIEMSTAFLRPVRRAGFRCRARIVKLGRRVVYGVAESTTADGELAAHHRLTYLRPEVGSRSGRSTD